MTEASSGLVGTVAIACPRTVPFASVAAKAVAKARTEAFPAGTTPAAALSGTLPLSADIAFSGKDDVAGTGASAFPFRGHQRSNQVPEVL
jgi:hypothetical protein